MLRVISFIKTYGLLRFIKKVNDHFFPPKIDNWRLIKKLLQHKKGLEIGGPSEIFNDTGSIPVYGIAESIDGCNFSNQTYWEGNIDEGYTYNYFNDKRGYQYVSEGSDLVMIGNSSYDFILSCHNLEHFANPIKALKEWYRILKINGIMLLILPDKTYTFDINRDITAYDHIIDDYNNNVSEDDMTHLEEVILKTDLNLYPKQMADSGFLFDKLCRDNSVNRCMHHHVFDLELLKKLFTQLDLSIIFTEKAKPHHLIIVGKKTSSILKNSIKA